MAPFINDVCKLFVANIINDTCGHIFTPFAHGEGCSGIQSYYRISMPQAIRTNKLYGGQYTSYSQNIVGLSHESLF